MGAGGPWLAGSGPDGWHADGLACRAGWELGAWPDGWTRGSELGSAASRGPPTAHSHASRRPQLQSAETAAPTQSAEERRAPIQKQSGLPTHPDRERRSPIQRQRRAPTERVPGGRGPPDPDTKRRASTQSAGPRHKEGAPAPTQSAGPRHSPAVAAAVQS